MWHVDDIKISHVDLRVVDEIIASRKMTVRRVKKHDYLGTTLDFSSKGNFIIDMEP